MGRPRLYRRRKRTNLLGCMPRGNIPSSDCGENQRRTAGIVRSPVNAAAIAASVVARTAQHAHTGHEWKPLRNGNGKYLAVFVSMGTAPVQVTFAFRRRRFSL